MVRELAAAAAKAALQPEEERGAALRPEERRAVLQAEQRLAARGLELEPRLEEPRQVARGLEQELRLVAALVPTLRLVDPQAERLEQLAVVQRLPLVDRAFPATHRADQRLREEERQDRAVRREAKAAREVRVVREDGADRVARREDQVAQAAT